MAQTSHVIMLMSGKKWRGELKGWTRGKETILYQKETEEFCARRNQLQKLMDEQLKVGETGPIVEGSDRDGRPIVHAYGYRPY